MVQVTAGTTPATHRHADALRRVDQLARVMDGLFRVPGTRIRVGLDSIIGLVPGVGDAATACVSLWLLKEAHRAGAPRRLLARMLGNVAVDLTVGAIPVIGDLFDLAWKANRRNASLLRDHLQKDSSIDRV
ncbi:MAG: DUF4112 domain-containing protein [Inquilinaceae bacterium]